MSTVKTLHQQEPVLTWGLIATLFNALQVLALPGIPIWVHSVIVIVSTIAGLLAARTQTVSKNNPEAVVNAAHDLGVLKK